MRYFESCFCAGQNSLLSFYCSECLFANVLFFYSQMGYLPELFLLTFIFPSFSNYENQRKDYDMSN